jgi:hypothetical protein
MAEAELIDALSPLINGGFLRLEPDASAPLAVPERIASPEKERETEKETEGEKRERRAARLTITDLPPEWFAFAEGEGHADPPGEWERFRDYWIAQPGQKGVKADWQATWRNWIRRAVDDGRGKKRGGSDGPDAFARAAYAVATGQQYGVDGGRPDPVGAAPRHEPEREGRSTGGGGIVAVIPLARLTG